LPARRRPKAGELYVAAACGGANQPFERFGLKLFPARRAEEHTGPAAQLVVSLIRFIKNQLQSLRYVAV